MTERINTHNIPKCFSCAHAERDIAESDIPEKPNIFIAMKVLQFRCTALDEHLSFLEKDLPIRCSLYKQKQCQKGQKA